MNLKNTKETYGYIARAFHWVMALIVLSLLGVGFYMSDLEPNPFKFQIYGLHKSFGLLLLFLAVCAVFWRVTGGRPEKLLTHKNWEKILSKVTQIILYVLLVAMPLSGWFMSSAGGHPVSFFGLFEMWSPLAKDKAVQGLFKELHEIFAFALLGLISLHIAGALKHHIVDRDTTLTRMGGHMVFIIVGVLLLCVPLFFVAYGYVKDIESQAQAQKIHVDIDGGAGNSRPD